jgi:hypothetical protein
MGRKADDAGNSDTDSAPNSSSDDRIAQDARIAELEKRFAELMARLSPETVGAPSSSSVDTMLLEQQNERIAELQRLIAGLGQRMATTQAVNARDEQFKAAVRSVESAAAALERSVSSATTWTNGQPSTTDNDDAKDDCGCEPCNCVSCDCCTFEVWMTQVRCDQMQNPLIDVVPPSADSNLLFTGMMEIWMFATIDPVHRIGACIPSATPISFIPVQKQLTDPFGPWEPAPYLIGTVSVKKGKPLTVPLSLTAVEREDAAERLQPGNRDEYGSAVQDITLDCCMSSYPPIFVSVGLTAGGLAGGGITAQFRIVKRC